MSQQNPNKEISIEFNIDTIKSKIEEIVKVSAGSFNIRDKNDLFNTYRITLVSGMVGGAISIILKKENDNSTLWKSEITNLPGRTTKVDNTATLVRLQDEFLLILSKGLSGEEITKELLKANKSGGCLGVAIVLISVSLGVTYLFCS
jgi:hypothetical protein